MHGLFNRSILCFAQDIYGVQTWERIVQCLDLETTRFEAMLEYPDDTTFSLLQCLSELTERSTEDLCEDLGTYLVSHPNIAALRRLLRFGGVTFVDFLHSLDELHGRAKLAVSTLDLPMLELREKSGGAYSLACFHNNQRFCEAFAFVLVGLLRAMADDYGALVYLEHVGAQGRSQIISINLLDVEFAEGRSFSLSEELG